VEKAAKTTFVQKTCTYKVDEIDGRTHTKPDKNQLFKRQDGSISPNFVCQAKSRWSAAFGKKYALQLHHHSVALNQPKTMMKFAKI